MRESIGTAIATPNVAMVKYWGRVKNEYNMPLNSSLGITLDFSLKTKTSVVFSHKLDRDRVIIDGKDRIAGQNNEKIANLIFVMNKLKKESGIDRGTHGLVVSQNSFPSDAGLSASSSGGAAFVLAANDALNLALSRKQLSILARHISGSACRSVYGGIVGWKRTPADGTEESYGEEVFAWDWWPELRDIVVILEEKKKKVPSSMGHDITPKTSSLYKCRPEYAEQSFEAAVEAIRRRDFDRLGMVIMRESNSMHATMLDSMPPIFYLNDRSLEIIQASEELNEGSGHIKSAYSFDAGPNPHLFTTQRYRNEVLRMLDGIDGVRKIIEVGVGSGPQMSEEHLIDDNFRPVLQHSKP